jgi:cilla- and flagella-associated protein
MTSLEVLSVSVNSITTLKDIGECPNLKELYIRRNSVESLDEIDYLAPLKNLKIMWLAENPVATRSGYRQYVLKKLP